VGVGGCVGPFVGIADGATVVGANEHCDKNCAEHSTALNDEFSKHKARQVDGHTFWTATDAHVDSSYASGSPLGIITHWPTSKAIPSGQRRDNAIDGHAAFSTIAHGRVGARVGTAVGILVGDADGTADGGVDGAAVGRLDGGSVGGRDGSAVGCAEGCSVGVFVGAADVGPGLGAAVGPSVGHCPHEPGHCCAVMASHGPVRLGIMTVEQDVSSGPSPGHPVRVGAAVGCPDGTGVGSAVGDTVGAAEHCVLYSAAHCAELNDEFVMHKSRHVDGHTFPTVTETHVDCSYASCVPCGTATHCPKSSGTPLGHSRVKTILSQPVF